MALYGGNHLAMSECWCLAAGLGAFSLFVASDNEVQNTGVVTVSDVLRALGVSESRP